MENTIWELGRSNDDNNIELPVNALSTFAGNNIRRSS
jgi:hypothetical protein